MDCFYKLDCLKSIDFARCNGNLSLIHRIISLLKVSNCIEELILSGNQLKEHEITTLSNGKFY